MNIDEMSAGRKMDALVAEKAMGWTQIQWLNSIDDFCGTSPRGGQSFVLLPHYSTDIEDVHDIIEHLTNLGCIVSVSWGPPINERHFVNVQILSALAPGADGVDSTVQAAPLAICRAALKLMEGK